MVKNAAVRVLTGATKTDHISPILASLYLHPLKNEDLNLKSFFSHK